MNNPPNAPPSPYWPDEDSSIPDELADDWSLELADEIFDALTPDDDYEPAPDPGDFSPEQDAA